MHGTSVHWQVFGGTIVRAPCGLMHGKSSPVWHTEAEETMLSGLPSPFQAARYHSLVISREGFPDDELEVTARESGAAARPPSLPVPVAGPAIHAASRLASAIAILAPCPLNMDIG